MSNLSLKMLAKRHRHKYMKLIKSNNSYDKPQQYKINIIKKEKIRKSLG